MPKTRLIIVTVEEGWPQCGIGAEIIALLNECKAAFSFLDNFTDLG